MVAQWESAAAYEAMRRDPVLGCCLKRHLQSRSSIRTCTRSSERLQLPPDRPHPSSEESQSAVRPFRGGCEPAVERAYGDADTDRRALDRDVDGAVGAAAGRCADGWRSRLNWPHPGFAGLLPR